MCWIRGQVLVPIGFGTEEMEAVIMVDVLRRAGADVTVASVEQQLEVEAAGGTKLVADTYISACSDQIFDLVALPVSFLRHCFFIFLLLVAFVMKQKQQITLPSFVLSNYIEKRDTNKKL